MTVAATALAAGIDDWPPRLSAGEVAGLNALHRRRGPIGAPFRDGRVEVALLAAAPAPDGPAYRVSIGGHPAIAQASRGLIEEIVAPLGLTRPLEALDPDAAALLVEYALSRDLERLGISDFVSIDMRLDQPVAPAAHAVDLSLKFGGREHRLSFRLGREGLEALSRALDRAARPVADPLAALAMPVRVCMGWQTVRVADLAGLARGDVILLETGKEMSGPIAVVADRLATRLSASSGRLSASSALKPLRGSHWEWCMEGEGPNGEGRVDDAEIDALPVKLVFELGRVDMALKDVRAIEAGAVVPLARALDEAVDIVANGRRIGRGSIVRIGDAVGVRVERLTADE